MATDNFNRYEAINAVVAAFTKYDSLPYITRKLVNGGQSAVFTMSTPFRGVIVTFSSAAALCGLYTMRVWDSGSANDVIAFHSASSLQLTYDPTTKRQTFRNNGTVNMEIYIISLRGSCEEV